MAYFPLFVDLAGKEILVIGGGKIAARRAGTLSEFGCRITVVSPEICEKMQELFTEGKIRWKEEAYRKDILSEYQPFFVLAAAGKKVNALVVSDCRERKLPVNDASEKENCDFYFPGIIKERDAVVGVTSGGGDHKMAAALSEAVRKFIKEMER